MIGVQIVAYKTPSNIKLISAITKNTQSTIFIFTKREEKKKEMASKLIAMFLISILTASSESTNVNRTPSYADFIRSKCNSTLYPSLCFRSLLPFSSQIQNSEIHLASAAANLSLSYISSLSSHIASLSNSSSLSRRDFLALHDCKDTMGDAVDLARQSVDEIGRLESAVGPEVAWRVSNAQTWMSAAITNEDTCTDGFGDGGAFRDKEVRDDVCGRVLRVRMLSSVALALVNALVYTGW